MSEDRSESLPHGASTWEYFTRVGDIRADAGRGFRRSVVLFFVVYGLAELLNASATSSVVVLGIALDDATAVLLFAPVILSLIFYEQAAFVGRMGYADGVLDRLREGMNEHLEALSLVATPPSPLSEHLDLMGAYEPARLPQRERARRFRFWPGMVLSLLLLLVLPLAEITALARTCLLAGEQHGIGWLTGATSLLIAALTIVVFFIEASASEGFSLSRHADPKVERLYRHWWQRRHGSAHAEGSDLPE